MANEAAKTQTINIVPVQGIFEPEPTFDLITLIGPAGTPFFAKIDPNQSGLNITNSTINSTTIGAITPSIGVFTNIATTTGTISSAPASANDIVNKQYVDYLAAGLSWKQPANAASTVNIASLSGLQTVDTVALVAGNTVLVKNQTNAADNGIYVVSSGPWTRSVGADTWDEYVGAIIFIVSGSQADSAWYSTAQPGGTLGVTAINWSNFSVSSTYSAGTGLTLTGTVFSITPVGTAGTYGSASAVPVFVTNASGQVSSVTNTPIAIANTQVSGLGTMSTQNANSVAITGGTINGTTIGGSTAAAVTGTIVTANTYFSGAGTNLTGTASGLSIGGNAATATSATSATTATNLAGGASGSLPYQSAPSTTTFLAAGSNGQVLTLASGVPSWATPTTGTVTSVSGTGTVSGISLSGTVTSSGNLTLGGTLDLSAPPVIGGTTPNTITGTTITANTKFVGTNFDAAGSGGGSLRTSGGTAVLQWGGGGGVNLTLDGAFNMNPANYSISIAPTGTGTLTVNPATAGTINNMSIGLTTAAAGYFTTLSLTSTLAVNGSTGTNGQVLQSNGSSAPTWVTPSSYATVTDDTTTNGTRYPLFANQTTGNLTTEFVSSTKLQFNPSTGVFTSTSFSGAGTGLTGTASGLSIGGNAATATSATSATTATTATNLANGTANQIPYQTGAGATSFITAPTVSSTALTWNGSAFTWAAATAGLTISDDTTTNATRYLTFTSATTGTITSENVSSTKLQFNPSTGAFTSTSLTPTNAVGIAYGGTGQTTASAAFNALSPITSTGDLILGNGTNSATRLAIGTNGYVLTSNGTTASWQAASGGGGITWQAVQTSGFTAVSNRGYPCNTTSAAFTVTLPASPSAGDTIVFVDYAGTFATNNLTIAPNGNKIIGSTSDKILYTYREGITFVYIDATQGWLPISVINDQTIVASYSVDYLVVAGGGGGGGVGAGAGLAGGGGAGGLVASSVTVNTGTSYSVVIGGGGAGGASGGNVGANGSNSTFSSFTATGGGGGSPGRDKNVNGSSGGSGGGGGGGGAGSGTAGGSGTSGQGNAGGTGATAPQYGGGGGGGASAVGGNGSASNGGNGGAGTNWQSLGTTYAGGGGGGLISGTVGSGGSGGGGAGGKRGTAPTAGTTNTGGGGGGNGQDDVGGAGANGGSGIVIIRYIGPQKGTGGTVTSSGGYTYHTFSSGSSSFVA